MNVDVELLRHLEPIKRLTRRRLEGLVDFCRLESFPLGADPFPRRIPLEHWVYLLSGEMRVQQPDGSTQLWVGGCAGECRPLGRPGSWSGSMRAVTNVVLMFVESDILDIMMTWDELTAVAEQSSAVQGGSGWDNSAFGAQAVTSGALSKLPAAHIHELLQRFERIPVKAGDVIIREGDAGNDYYLIESGRVDIHRMIGGVSVCVAELKTGEAFGEEALVSGAPRNATVTMKTDGSLLRLGKLDFAELLQTPLLQTVSRLEAERRIAEEGACWLDVRYPVEFVEDGLPGALNLPLNEIRPAFALLDREREYIVYCQSGRRSSAAAFLLAQRGFKASLLEHGIGPRVQL